LAASWNDGVDGTPLARRASASLSASIRSIMYSAVSC
jgi:hypothetical protein